MPKVIQPMIIEVNDKRYLLCFDKESANVCKECAFNGEYGSLRTEECNELACMCGDCGYFEEYSI